jgi:hypothetical protein
MTKLENLKRGATVKGILPDCLVTVIDVKWYGSAAVELTYKDPAGKPAVVLLYRDHEPTLEIGETGRPWSFDGDGKMFRLVSEAQRISLAHLFDPLLYCLECLRAIRRRRYDAQGSYTSDRYGVVKASAKPTRHPVRVDL